MHSVIKLILYGPRFRINQSYPGNIGNLSLQHSPESWKYYPNPKPNPKPNPYPFLDPGRVIPGIAGGPGPGIAGGPGPGRRAHPETQTHWGGYAPPDPPSGFFGTGGVQVTPTTTTTTRRQLYHLARPLDHHAQGPNIPFGVNPSLR